MIKFILSQYAYLDPGSGSYFFQLCIAGILAGIFTLKSFWLRCLERLCQIFKRKGS